MKFREYGEILHGKRYSLMLKGKVYRSYVRSAILYENETWCLWVKELSILRRTEEAMVRAMCGMKLMDRKNTDELMDMLRINETFDKMAIASGVPWFGHVLRRDESDVLREVLQFKVDERRRRGWPRNTWKKQVEKEMQKAGLKSEDAHDRKK